MSDQEQLRVNLFILAFGSKDFGSRGQRPPAGRDCLLGQIVKNSSLQNQHVSTAVNSRQYKSIGEIGSRAFA